MIAWKDTQGVLQESRRPFEPVYPTPLIVSASTDSFEHGINLKVHATKKYEHGTILGYALSADKKLRTYQHMDSAGTVRYQKEGFGILITHSSVGSFEYKNAANKTTRPWSVLIRNATINESALIFENIADIDKIILQLLLNSNIIVVRNSTTHSNLIISLGISHEENINGGKIKPTRPWYGVW